MPNKVAVWKVITNATGLREHYPDHEPPTDGGPFLVVELDDQVIVFNLDDMRGVLEGYQKALTEQRECGVKNRFARDHPHPIKAFRQLPRWRRMFKAWAIYRRYRGWDNGRWAALVLTWRAVAWR